MFCSHLHSGGRHDPYWHLAVEHEFRPFGADQLAGADKAKRKQSQSEGGLSVSDLLVFVDRPEQRRHLLGLHSSLVLALVRRKCTPKIGGGIALASASCDPVPEYLRGHLQDAMCQVMRSAMLYLAHSRKQLWRGDFCDWSGAQVRE